MSDSSAVLFFDLLNTGEERRKKLREGKEWLNEIECVLVKDIKEFKKIVDRAIEADSVAIDTETTGLDTRVLYGKPASEMVGFSLCFDDKAAYYVPVRHKNNNVPINPAVEELTRLATKAKKLVFFNYKFDAEVLRNEGVDGLDSPRRIEDVMVLAHLKDPDSKSIGRLKVLSRNILGKEMLELDDLFLTPGKKKTRMKRYPLEILEPWEIVDYAASDAYITRCLYLYYKDIDFVVEQESIKNLEMAVQPIVRWMERNRCLIDVAYLERHKKALLEKCAELQKEIYKITGTVFDITSPEQVSKVLFEDLGYPPTARKDKSYDTSKKALQTLDESLDENTPILKMIPEFKAMSHTVTTYINPFLMNVDDQNLAKFLFDPLRTSSGRFASQGGKKTKGGKTEDGYCGVQAQNIKKLRDKKKKAEGFVNIRSAIIARPGTKILSIDYSQIELRLAAILSGEPFWIESFKSGGDPHRKMAAQIFDIPESEVTDVQRQVGKTCNFSLLYKGWINPLINQLGCSVEDAKMYHQKFFENVPVYKKWTDKIARQTKKLGYASTLWGRRRPFPDMLLDRNDPEEGWKVKAAERECVNHTVQGTAADILKTAMTKIYRYIRKNNLQDRVLMISTVHDELVFEVDETILPRVAVEIENIMGLKDVPKFKEVGLLVESDVGDNWGDMVGLNEYLKSLNGDSAEEEDDIPDPRQAIEDELEQLAAFDDASTITVTLSQPLNNTVGEKLAKIIREASGSSKLIMKTGNLEMSAGRSIPLVDPVKFIELWTENFDVFEGSVSIGRARKRKKL